MAGKVVKLDGVGEVTLHKRRGARHIRLSVSSDGMIRVSLPAWAPYAAGMAMVHERRDWLAANRPSIRPLDNDMRVGRSHVLQFSVTAKLQNSQSATAKPTVRVNQQIIKVKLPAGMLSTDEPAQAAARRGCYRALTSQSEAVLPARLRFLAAQHGFEFRSVSIRRLKSRWGSCNDRREIVLNCFLMQLDDRLIDYVLLHELMHTRIMAHGPEFWQNLAEHVDDLPNIRREIRRQRPVLDVSAGKTAVKHNR